MYRMVPLVQSFKCLNFKVQRYFSFNYAAGCPGILGHYRFLLHLNYLRDQEMPSKRLQTGIQTKTIVYLWIASNSMLKEIMISKHP